MGNPYLDAAGPYISRGTSFGLQLDGSRARTRLAKKYAWAIPDEGALSHLALLSPLVEIGAGTGYWAHLLQERGADVVAYDDGSWKEHRRKLKWTTIRQGSAGVLAKHSDRALFLCWPPYDDPLAAECLAAYRGQAVAYIGEDSGGCTGDEDFHCALARDWSEVRTVSIPQWWGMHDALTIYRRKS